jgi:transcription elongation factor Elf1
MRRKSRRLLVRRQPYLTLCPACNHRAYDAGKKAETEGVELCPKCVQSLDGYLASKAAFDRRRARNQRKAERRVRA